MKWFVLSILLIQFGLTEQATANDTNGFNIATFFIESNEKIRILCHYSIEGEAPKEVAKRMKGIITKIDRVNSKLRLLEKKLQAGPKTLESYKKITDEVFLHQNSIREDLEVSLTFDYPAYVSNPIGGSWPIEDLPVRPPKDGDCEAQGDAIKNDCMIAAEMLENCGAIDTGQKTVMQFGCETAGQAEENACNIAAMQDSYRGFTEGEMRLGAQVQCQRHEEMYGAGNPPETDTNTGN